LHPTAVGSPETALNLLTSGERFDVIVVDFKMPKMNGFEFTTAARAAFGEATPPMILFTSVAPLDVEFREGAARMEYAATLPKPAKSGQLLVALLKALAPDHQVRSSPDRAATAALPTQNCELHVLLVDDNSINRKVGQKILKTLGFEAVVVGSGAEAISRCREEEFDIVLMDIEMPDMDGIATTSRIRSILPPGRVPYIVALTANAMATERETYLKSGMDDYLSKPIDVEALSASIDAARRHRVSQADEGHGHRT
jgi:CheY-like chemotaxis protein